MDVLGNPEAVDDQRRLHSIIVYISLFAGVIAGAIIADRYFPDHMITGIVLGFIIGIVIGGGIVMSIRK
ncbi:hypothetical protein GOV09_04245 [Candidatus Woesearchaeota archaeon]|nr:hypothetical protein [Candidatus Woesearchaeota archaeon]